VPANAEILLGIMDTYDLVSSSSVPSLYLVEAFHGAKAVGYFCDSPFAGLLLPSMSNFLICQSSHRYIHPALPSDSKLPAVRSSLLGWKKRELTYPKKDVANDKTLLATQSHGSFVLVGQKIVVLNVHIVDEK